MLFLFVFSFVLNNVNAQGSLEIRDSLSLPKQPSVEKSIPFEDTFRNPFIKMYKYGIQPDVVKTPAKTKKNRITDTTQYSPKKAAIWAAACPGLGQIYNKKYWKLPIVYGVIGTVTYFVASNGKKLKQFNGYIRNYYNDVPNPSPYDQLGISELETFQNTYRRNVQIASFGTIFAWGLSIVDAVVDAHLRNFDIGDNLSMKIKPQINSIDNSYYTGLALNLTFK